MAFCPGEFYEASAGIGLPLEHVDSGHVVKASPGEVSHPHFGDGIDVAVDASNAFANALEAGGHGNAAVAAHLFDFRVVDEIGDDAVALPGRGDVEVEFHAPVSALRVVVDGLMDFPAILPQEEEDVLYLSGAGSHGWEEMRVNAEGVRILVASLVQKRRSLNMFYGFLYISWEFRLPYGIKNHAAAPSWDGSTYFVPIPLFILCPVLSSPKVHDRRDRRRERDLSPSASLYS